MQITNKKIDRFLVEDEILQTTYELCKWLQSKCEKASSEELKAIPDVLKGVGELYASIR